MSYWNIKVYDDGVEAETIRGLTHSQVDGLFAVFDREGVSAQAMKYDDEGTEMLESRSNQHLKNDR